MKDDKLCAELEELAGRLGIKVSIEKIIKNPIRQPHGGLCRVDGEPRIIIHKKLNDSEKAQVLIDSLREFNLEGVHISPELRQVIEGAEPLLKQGAENN